MDIEHPELQISHITVAKKWHVTLVSHPDSGLEALHVENSYTVTVYNCDLYKNDPGYTEVVKSCLSVDILWQFYLSSESDNEEKIPYRSDTGQYDLTRERMAHLCPK